MKIKILLPFVILLLLIAPVVYASTSIDFLPKAQKYINNTCGIKHLASDQSLFCYLFYKVQEHDTSISNINNTISPIPSKITDLQNRVSKLESEINTTPPPIPGTIVFAYNRPASFSTDGTTIPITPNYNWETMTMHVSTTGTLYGYSLIVNVGSGDFEQVRILCPSNTCPDTTIPLVLDSSLPRAIYKFSTGTSSGNITAIGTLNAEPNSHTIFLGSNLTLPYTSGDLVTSGYSQIEFTVGQANPQNLKSISIQQFDGTNWNEVHHTTCDGGAICPVELVTIGSTFHRTRVVVDGSGNNAAIDYYIRP